MEEINKQCIEYLSKNSFVRNYSCNEFVFEKNFEIHLHNLYCYCVGIVDKQRIVHVIKILNQKCSPGVTSYYIEWYDIACYTLEEIFEMDLELSIKSIKFWVHSGVALRKNFFLYEDRMSLLKSTFIYDRKRNLYYRLNNLLPYINQNKSMTLNKNVPIFSSLQKVTYITKKTKDLNKKNNKQSNEDIQLISLQKTLKKLTSNFNSFGYLERNHLRLFKEINIIINSK
jgi:hypothetical protein